MGVETVAVRLRGWTSREISCKLRRRGVLNDLPRVDARNDVNTVRARRLCGLRRASGCDFPVREADLGHITIISPRIRSCGAGSPGEQLTTRRVGVSHMSQEGVQRLVG